ncbi:Polarity suppression protein [Escherichia coli]|nr:Polarity suppression protein [Escherichia coli]
MTTMSLQQAFEVCQNNKAAWLQRKNELAAAEQEYLRLQSGEGRSVSRLDELRNIIEVRKWQVNQAAGRYIRSHEAVQHISIRYRLNDFMQQHGTALAAALAAALAPELMGYSELTAIARNCAIQRTTDALREALLSWLAKGEKINYSAQDSDILTTIGFRPDAASVDDSREKFTPAQNMIFSRKSAELASRQSV